MIWTGTSFDLFWFLFIQLHWMILGSNINEEAEKLLHVIAAGILVAFLPGTEISILWFCILSSSSMSVLRGIGKHSAWYFKWSCIYQTTGGPPLTTTHSVVVQQCWTNDSCDWISYLQPLQCSHGHVIAISLPASRKQSKWRDWQEVKSHGPVRSLLKDLAHFNWAWRTAIAKRKLFFDW